MHQLFNCLPFSEQDDRYLSAIPATVVMTIELAALRGEIKFILNLYDLCAIIYEILRSLVL